MSWYNDLEALFFPKRCVACNESLLSGEEIICVECRAAMPLTHYWMMRENYLTDLFAGRILLNTAASLFYYQKESHFRDMIHDLKYHNARDVGDVMGQIFGFYLKSSPLYKSVDLIVPVPLHRKRLALRGYNQAEVFARGISKETGIRVENRALVRTKNTDKQALKHTPHQRWENVEGAFAVKDKSLLEGRNIMIVDDVITTGATIEACTRAIEKEIPNSTFFVTSIACVKKGL